MSETYGGHGHEQTRDELLAVLKATGIHGAEYVLQAATASCVSWDLVSADDARDLGLPTGSGNSDGEWGLIVYTTRNGASVTAAVHPRVILGDNPEEEGRPLLCGAPTLEPEDVILWAEGLPSTWMVVGCPRDDLEPEPMRWEVPS